MVYCLGNQAASPPVAISRVGGRAGIGGEGAESGPMDRGSTRNVGTAWGSRDGGTQERRSPCWSGLKARLYRVASVLLPPTPTSHTSEPSTPIKHLLWQGTRGQTWSSQPSPVRLLRRRYAASKALWGHGSWDSSGHSVWQQRWHLGEGVLVCGVSGSRWEEACPWALSVICDGYIPVYLHTI